jgi:DNA-binding beta-propeller fold protein YncE
MKKIRIAAFALLVCLALPAAAAPSHKVIERLPGPDGRWDYASIDKAHHRLLVGRADGVLAYDIATPGAPGVVIAPAQGGHAAIEVDGGNVLLVTNGAANTVTMFDTTGTLLATVPTGKNPDAATFDPKTGLVLVMDHSGGDVTLIDAKKHVAAGSIEIGGALEAAAVDGAGRAYINVEDKNEVAVIDIAKRKVIARYPVANCASPTGIAYVPQGRRLVVACQGTAAIVSARTGQEIKTIKIGAGADGAVYDGARRLAYVSAGRDGSLAVLSVTAKNVTLVETVPTQVGARTLAVDPDSGKVYLPTATYLPAATPGGRPTTAPGTFTVLVVGE